MLSRNIGKVVVNRNSLIDIVYIVPRKCKTLSATHSGIKQNPNNSLKILITLLCIKQFQKLFCLFFIENRLFLLAAIFRKNNIVARRFTDKTLLYTSVENALRDGYRFFSLFLD